MLKREKIVLLDPSLQQKKTIPTIFNFIKQPLNILTSQELKEERIDDFFSLVVNFNDTNNEQFNLLDKLITNRPFLSIIFLGDIPNIYTPLSMGKTSHFLQEIREPLFYNDLTVVLNQSKMYYHSYLPKIKNNNLTKKLIGNSSEINKVRTLIEQVSSVDANVLILGESGTGKEITAQSIHDCSHRAKAPFVPINCGAIPGDLLESELFGHEKGAFTGAITTRKGRFELANGGTVFLDEIGDMPLAMQVKLLRVLQERKFERIGSNQSIEVDVRIIAATHRDLDLKILKGEFREDLYYRLNVFPIEIPPLRQRAQDIPLLINELRLRLESQGRLAAKLMPDAIAILCQYSWPGNIRELANMIERLSILYPNGVVDLAVLPSRYKSENTDFLDNKASLFKDKKTQSISSILNLSPKGIDLKEHLVKTEVCLIIQALDESNWVVARAAEFLNMRRTTLVEKIKKHGLTRVEKV